MNKLFVVGLSISLFTLLTAHAAVYKGQREFVRNCVKCHKEGQVFIATKRKIEWKSYTKAKGKKLMELHLSSKKAEKSHDYFEGRKFSRGVRHLEDFLLEYAKDSGNVPACN